MQVNSSEYGDEMKAEIVRKKVKVDSYVKSKKSENIGVRVSKAMTMDISNSLERSGADNVAEFIRLAIAEKLSSISVADRVQDQIEGIVEGLTYTRNKIEDSGDENNKEVMKIVMQFVNLLDERDKKFTEMMHLRDVEFKEISESMIQLTAFITQQYGDIEDEVTGGRGSANGNKSEINAQSISR